MFTFFTKITKVLPICLRFLLNSRKSYRCEINSLPRLHVNKRLNYSKLTEREIQLFLQFLKNHIHDYQAGLREAAAHIGISHDTLTHWRNKLRDDPDYNPKKKNIIEAEWL